MKQVYIFVLFLFCVFVPGHILLAQKTAPIPEGLITPDQSGVTYRNIGPFRGGRSAAVTGVAGKPNLFYFGSTGGGVWRTTDGGRSWDNLSDGFFGGSVGAVEVAPSDPNVIYAGGGEVTVRGNVSYGSGIWKTEDAGRTWKNKGLTNSRQIPRIRVHPTNSDWVYAAVLGDLFKDSDERGVFRSKDGGNTWEKVLFVNNASGAVDLCLDPVNPRIMYASTWRIRRTPYDLSSGGDGSGLWKSTDGGDTWTDITRNEGLPKDTLGIIGVTVSPANPDRIWAIIESKTGGVFRSDDAGKTWAKINEDRSLRQRAWYYSRIYADTRDQDIVYVLNVSYHKSKDGGKTFSRANAPHGDHHDLWIAPEDPQRMIIADDGGAQTSYDGGETWSTYHNQPTAQFYRVTTDNAFPFRIYAAQQDNTSVRIAHRSDGGNIGMREYEPTAGGESGHIAVDPLNDNIIFGGEYHGYLSRVDHERKTFRAVNVWPEDNMGHGAEDAKYRFQWNFPLFFSPHNPKKLYACSNYLHATTNEGQSWTTISPDLTTNDKSRQKSSGGPITQDNTGVEYYCTIFAAAESPRVADIIWTGSDDGLVQVTRDGGKKWTNVTPKNLPKWAQINSIEPDPHVDGGCYFAATCYKSGDNQPYLFYTADYGANWKLIVKGIDPQHFTRVLRADPLKAGLLYAGTEEGTYLSYDNGANWQSFQINLPVVPVTDLTIKENKLIVATQGRGLWIIDDLAPIQQLAVTNLSAKSFRLFTPGDSWRTKGGARKSKFDGENHPNGVMVHFWVKEKPTEKDSLVLTFSDTLGNVLRRFTTTDKKNILKIDKGGNRFVWDMRMESAKKFDGMILWSYDLEGPKVVPGKYRVRLDFQGQTDSADFRIVADPRVTSSPKDFQEQFDFVQSVSKKITDAHTAIEEIRKVRGRLEQLKLAAGKSDRVKPLLTEISATDSLMTLVEKALYQTQNQSPQDPLNFPVRLNDKLANLMGQVVQDDFPPTAQAAEVRSLLFEQTDAELAKWNQIKKETLPRVNQLIHTLDINVIVPD